MANQQVNVVTNQISVMAENLNMKGIDESSLYHTLTNTVFKGANNEQLASLMIVANQYGLNPFTKEIYAFPSRGGVVPIVSVDGWARIINDNPNCDGIQFEQDAESATCKIYRKDRNHPTIVTEYLSECKMNTDPWKKYPKRMLRHKALIQCARVAFGFSGIYDQDEAERIDGSAQQAPSVVDIEQVDSDYDEFFNEQNPLLQAAANGGISELGKAHAELLKQENKKYVKRLWDKVSPDLKQLAQKADMDRAQTVEAEYTEVIDESIAG